MKQFESVRRMIILQLRALCLIFQAGLFAYMWYKYYAMHIEVTFWTKGHWGVIGIYTILLLFFSQMYGGMKIGYLKAVEVFFSQLFATLCANLFGYAQVCLLSGGFADVRPILALTGVDIIGIGIWAAGCDTLYKRIFPPRDLLLIHGGRPIDDIVNKFTSRKDKYQISKCINEKEGLAALYEEIMNRYDGVVLWDISIENRNKLLKYCYKQSIRVYLMPKITDVILTGSDQLHMFDTPIFLTREYSLTIDQRMAKRLIDLICAIILLIIGSPFMLITALIIKLSDGGPVLYKQTRCTRDGKEFQIMKFRSMRVDAEKDGVARLATQNDSRITPFGRFIRKIRIDELPQLLNILKGEMSFIGPRPERPEIIAQYMEYMPEFEFRMKVKAGLAGYAQVYGKYNTLPYDKLKLDLYYIENYSVWLDVRLMFLTLKILFQPDRTEGIEDTQVTAMKEIYAEEEEENRGSGDVGM